MREIDSDSATPAATLFHNCPNGKRLAELRESPSPSGGLDCAKRCLRPPLAPLGNVRHMSRMSQLVIRRGLEEPDTSANFVPHRPARPTKIDGGRPFTLVSEYQPAGDQRERPPAIDLGRPGGAVRNEVCRRIGFFKAAADDELRHAGHMANITHGGKRGSQSPLGAFQSLAGTRRLTHFSQTLAVWAIVK